MITISGTQKIQLVTSSGADIDVHVSYTDMEQISVVELSVTELTRGTQTTAITTATTTDVIDAPGTGIIRMIDKISIRNIDSSVSNSVYLVIDDSGTDYKIIPTVKLAAGELYDYETGNGWKLIDATGLVVEVLSIYDIKIYYAVSTTAITITSGIVNFAIDDGLAYEVGQRVRLTYDEYNYIEGVIKAYGTGAMQIYVDYRVGSGSYSQWILSPTTEQRVPEGGSAGQVLTKGSSSDYDVTWATPSAGGGSNSDYNNSFFLMGA